MPRDYRRSYSGSPRRSRSRSRNNDRDKRDGSGGRNGNDYESNSNGRDRSRDRYSSNNRDRSSDRSNDEDLCRIHVADLTESVSKSEIEKAFSKYGELKEVWMAKNPPCFAFVVYKNKDDASAAVKEMDQRTVGSSRVRVTYARPRTKGRRRQFDPNMRCYQCGQRGHFSRDCDAYSRRRHDRSYSRDRYKRRRSRSRSHSRRRRSNSRGRNSRGGRRSRSRSKSYERKSRSRSRTPRRDYNKSAAVNGSSNGDQAN